MDGEDLCPGKLRRSLSAGFYLAVLLLWGRSLPLVSMFVVTRGKHKYWGAFLQLCWVCSQPGSRAHTHSDGTFLDGGRGLGGV